jgi:hypothetical protein
MKNFLESFASILGVCTVAMLILAVSHELGYFWLVGWEFQALLTTTDYLSNAVFWLPFALVFAYGAIDWWRLEENRVEPSKNWRKVSSWIWPGFCTLVVCILAFFSTWPPNTSAIYVCLSVIIFFWSKVWRRIPLEFFEEPFRSVARGFVRLGIPAMLVMFAHGWWTAGGDIETMTGADIFRFKDIPAVQLRVALRSMDKGMLLRDPVSDRIEFHRWESIESISRIRKKPARSAACYFFEWCPGLSPSQP